MTTELTILDDDGEQLAGEDDLFRDSDVPDGVPTSSLRQAAVLMPLVRRDDGWHLMFIRRSSNERDRHSGQVAFPGGAAESYDADAQATALREANEEIGLSPAQVTPLLELPAYRTISHFAVTPWVARIDGAFEPVLQMDEVARVFTIPLAWLADRSNLTRRARSDMDPATARRHPIIVYAPYDGEVLWGASARMTLNLLRALDRREFALDQETRRC